MKEVIVFLVAYLVIMLIIGITDIIIRFCAELSDKELNKPIPPSGWNIETL